MKNKYTHKIENTQSSLNLFQVKNKPIELSYTGEKISVDGGLLLLKDVDNQLGIINKFSSCIDDDRDQRYIDHTIESIVSQRVYQIAAGYEDANDCNTLRNDAVIKLCSNQLPETDIDLGSQSTMSRFENSVRRSELYRIAKMFVEEFITSYESEPPVIILDPDDTNNNAYGNQLQIEYNHYYGEYVFMPLHIYEGFSGKLITTILKPGRRSKSVSVFSILKRIIELLRQHWKNTTIIVRGDSHFHSPELTSYSNAHEKIILITGLTGNSILKKLSETTVKSAEKQFKNTSKPVRMYHSFTYKADSWEYSERVIVKVEVTSMGTNIRYIATNTWEYRAKQMYEIGYRARGNAELRIKGHKTYLKSDRTSCNKFEANQLRMFFHSIAYVLTHTLQKDVLRGTEFANSTMETIQLKLLKTAAKVKELKTKIKIEFPRICPVRDIQTKAFNILEILRYATVDN
ncbi:MAG: IS1380 family transposase [Desulfobacula sp.]|nr:IS1380 family transposase [Desulfobacula sp.]